MAKQELQKTIRDRYQASSRKDNNRSLDEFITVTGYHRKHGVRAAGAGRGKRSGVWRQRPAHKQPGRERGGDPGLGNIGPHLRQASESGVAPLDRAHGAPWPPRSRRLSDGTAAGRQHNHAGPVAHSRSLLGGQPTQPAAWPSANGSYLHRLEPATGRLSGNRSGGPLRGEYWWFLRLQSGGHRRLQQLDRGRAPAGQ